MFRACVEEPHWHLVPPTRDGGGILEIHPQYRGPYGPWVRDSNKPSGLFVVSDHAGSMSLGLGLQLW